MCPHVLNVPLPVFQACLQLVKKKVGVRLPIPVMASIGRVAREHCCMIRQCVRSEERVVVFDDGWETRFKDQDPVGTPQCRVIEGRNEL